MAKSHIRIQTISAQSEPTCKTESKRQTCMVTQQYTTDSPTPFGTEQTGGVPLLLHQHRAVPLVSPPTLDRLGLAADWSSGLRCLHIHLRFGGANQISTGKREGRIETLNHQETKRHVSTINGHVFLLAYCMVFLLAYVIIMISKPNMCFSCKIFMTSTRANK